MPRPVDLHTCVALLDRIIPSMIPCKLIAQKPRAISQVHTESSPESSPGFITSQYLVVDRAVLPINTHVTI